MPSRFVMTFQDNTQEKSVSQFVGESMGAANYAAQETLQNDLAAAVNALTLATHYKTSRVASEAVISTVVPAKTVQNEEKWLVRYHVVSTGRRLTSEIPAADKSLLVDGTERMDNTIAAYTDFVAAFEAYVKADGADAVAVDEVIYVTRNT